LDGSIGVYGHRQFCLALKLNKDDITRDISEQKNVASEHPEIVADMAKIMKAEHVDRKRK